MTAQWEEGKYGFWFLRLPGGFTVTIGWDSTRLKGSDEATSGWKVSFEDATLKKRFTNLEEAKKAGINLAIDRLGTALASLR